MVGSPEKTQDESYRLILENISDTVIVTDDQGHMRYISPNAKNIFGCSPDEIRYHQTIHNLMNGTVCDISELKKQNEFKNIEWTITDASGLARSLRITVKSVSIDGGTVLYVMQDVTAQKKLEDDLRESLLRQTEVIRAGNIGLWDWDLLTNQVRYSKEWKRQIGFEDHEIGNNFEEWRNRVHPDDIESALEQVQQSIVELNQNHQTEFRFRHKDGSYRWILAQAAIIQIDSGKAIRMLGSHIDITKHKEAQTALTDNRTRLKAALESMTDAVFISDREGRFVEFNTAFATFHRFKEKAECLDILSDWTEIIEVYDPEGQLVPLEMWAVSRALRGEKITNAEYTLRRKDTGERWIGSYSFAPIYNKTGEIDGSVVVGRDITHQRQIEKALEEREQVMRYIIKHDPNAIAVYDRHLHYIAVSDRYLVDYNVKDKHILGKHHYEVFPEMPQRWKEVHQRVLQGATERNDDDYFERPDGSITYNRWECRPWYTAKGSIGGMITYTEVTTERKMAEKALTEANRKLGAITDFLPDPTFVIDQQGIVQMWNRAMVKITGIESEHMIGKGDYEYALPFYGQRRPLLIDLILHWDKQFESKYILLEKRSGGGIVGQSYHPGLNGGTYLLSTASILYDSDGKPSGAIESLRDISEFKQAEIALRDSEMKFRNLFNSIRDAILVADTNREIVGCNPAFTDLFGYSEDEILGKPTRFVYESDDQYSELGQKLKENADNTEFLYTVRYRKKSGDSFPGETGVYYLKDTNDEINGFIGLIRNIEDRLNAEDDLRRSKNRLKSLVDNLFDAVLVTDQKGVIQFANPAAQTLFGKEEDNLIGMDFGFPITLNEAFDIGIVQSDAGLRQVEARATITDWQGNSAHLISLRDLTEKILAEQERDAINLQLQQSQKIESIGRLAGGVAHDFNNMLSIILGYGQELMGSLHESDPLHECASEIVEAGRRSAALTRQLLAFSRKQTLQPEVLNLNYIVKNIEKVLRRLIGEDIELETKFAQDLERVEVDPGQIEQVIMNLAVNARDAMPEGGKLMIETANVIIDETFVKVHMGAVPGAYVMISITDTGCGMDSETRERAFEPFYTTKEKDRGTGLGLSTVYGIVKQSGGSIWLYSEPGKGSTFKIYLPQAAGALPNQKMKKEDGSFQGNNELILVVEDEASIRKLSTRILTAMKYRVKAVSSGGEALLLIEEKKLKPDLLLTDVVMPGMSGKVLVARLKKTLPDLPVIYMSGYTDDTIAHHGVLYKGTPFVQKPFTKETLGKKVRSVLNQNLN